jgi:hypothetical protein
MPTTTFCTDVDLLHWEPDVLRDAAFASQTLLAGTGSLTGTSFTIPSGSFADAHVSSDNVIVLAGEINGCFPIVSVTSATQLTISVLYDQLTEPQEAEPSPIGTVPSIPFVIRTFWPQRAIVSEMLQQAAGAGVARLGEAPAQIIDNVALRRPCALGTLHMIYSALAAAASEPEAYRVRADLYERHFRRALRCSFVELDLDGDGEGDVVRALNVLDLRRS